MPATPPSLTSLPTEILREICGYLSISSTLTFLHVSRTIYHACNEWMLWRDLVKQSRRYPSGVPLVGSEGDADAWKRYAIAAHRAASRRREIEAWTESECWIDFKCWTDRDLETWLPQLVVLGRVNLIKSQDSAQFRDDCDSALKSISSELTEEMDVLDARSWKRVQAAAFCLSAKDLKRPFSGWSPLQPIDQWLEIPIGNLEALRMPSEDDQDKLMIAQHALGNLAIGFLYETVRHYLDDYTAPNYSPKLFKPPQLYALPFRSSMQLPLPFSADSLDRFSRCHLPIMTDPAFFLNSEWTGYECRLNATGTARVTLVGGKPFGEDDVGDIFSGILQFSLATEYSADMYRVDSNKFFHNPSWGVYQLTIRVEKSTGQLRIIYRAEEQHTRTIDGVMTPFGIVGRADEGRRWVWLWKTEWSE